ncbi:MULTISPECIES: M15 family metallopeptidase [Brevibacterium]|uniref:M15 family metallopeptidase n=1 Tax=Brevibacterium TaxID=1696 RepID=UPI00299F8BDC|nr:MULTISPECIES: M15 family metallopeptidase [Brevibacterium]
MKDSRRPNDTSVIGNLGGLKLKHRGTSALTGADAREERIGTRRGGTRLIDKRPGITGRVADAAGNVATKATRASAGAAGKAAGATATAMLNDDESTDDELQDHAADPLKKSVRGGLKSRRTPAKTGTPAGKAAGRTMTGAKPGKKTGTAARSGLTVQRKNAAAIKKTAAAAAKTKKAGQAAGGAYKGLTAGLKGAQGAQQAVVVALRAVQATYHAIAATLGTVVTAKVWLIVLVVVVVLALVISIVSILPGWGDAADNEDNASCTITGTIDDTKVEGVPDKMIGGYGKDGLTNAAIIIEVARTTGFEGKGEIVGLITAMQESRLGTTPGIDKPNGDGDAGMFQQRQLDGWYGSLEQVTDPVYASTAFFNGVTASESGGYGSAGGGAGFGHIPGLTDVDGWKDMSYSGAAQAVQRSAFPDAYATHVATAKSMVTALEDTTVTIGESDCSSPGEGGDYPPPGSWKEPGAWGGYDNGKIPLSEMSEIPWAKGEYVRKDSLGPLVSLNKKFKKKFGYDLGITDSYRDYDEQVATKKAKGNMAATPGTSKHGWGLALDLGTGINNFGTPEYNWMKDNAPAHGWRHPDWAEPSGSLPEPWHWEFWGVK